MPFAITGLLQQMEETKRRMQGPLAPPPDAFQLPQNGAAPPQGAPMAPPLAPAPEPSAFANVANANISDPNDLSYQYRPGIKGRVLGLLGADRVAPELQALLTPDQIKRVKPGVVGSLWNAINYGVGPQTVMQARTKNMLGLTDEAANRKTDAEMKRQRALIAADYATMPNDPAKRYEALVEMTGRLAAIGHPDAAKYANILNAIKPDAPRELGRQSLQITKDVIGEDGLPYTVWTNVDGQEVKRERQYIPPKGDMTEFQRQSLDLRRRELGARVKGETGVQLSGPAIEKLIALDDAISAASDATTAMESAKTAKADVSGRVGGVLPVPGWVRNQLGQGGDVGRSARSKIGNLTSMIGNLRSGGAITPQEFERLETFLPTANEDEAVVEGKLKDFNAFLQQMRKTRLEAYQKYGKGGAGAGQAKPPTQDQKDWDEAVAMYGRDKVLSEYGPRPEGD